MRILLVIFCCTWSAVAFGQTTTLSMGMKFIEWHREHPQVTPYIYLNQSKYAPGDTVFFKAWLLLGDFTQPAGTFVMKMSLVNSAAQEVAHQSLRIARGTSGNQFVLPDTLAGGFYKLVLYSNWMKHYGTETFHQREIEVVTKNQLAKTTTVPDVQLFIEGCQLVYDIPAKVAVLTNQPMEGQLIDDRGVTVTSVSIGPGHAGFVVFTPESGRQYAMQLNGREYPIPSPSADGFSLVMTTNENRAPVRTVLAIPPGSKFSSETFQVLVTMNDNLYLSQQVNFADRNFKVLMIPQAQLPPGVATMSVFNSRNELICSRNFFVSTSGKTVVKIAPAKLRVATRQKIDVEISLTDEAGLMVQGDMAVGAVNQKVFDADYMVQFSDELLLGKVKLARDFIIDRTRPDWYQVLDQHMIASAPRQPWLDPAAQQKNPSYLNTWLYARGRLFDQTTNQPPPDTSIVNLFLQKNPIGYEVRSVGGFIDAYIPMDFWGKDEFFYHVTHNGVDLPNVRLEWVDEKVDFIPAERASITNQPDTYAAFRAQKNSIDRSYSFFRAKAPDVEELIVDLNAEIEDEIMGADISVNLDDYIAFTSMDEVIREIIPALQHRRSGDRSIVRVILVNPNFPAAGNPLYIIDGVMTMDTDFFINLDQKNVHSIKVVNDQSKLKYLGALGRNGVVLVTSKKSVATAARTTSKLIGITGLSRPLNFKSVKHVAAKSEPMPDFRSTLYWNPSVTTDNDGKARISFEASDDIGPVRIHVAGITKDGRAFSGSALVEVVFED